MGGKFLFPGLSAYRLIWVLADDLVYSQRPPAIPGLLTRENSTCLSRTNPTK
jgi:hypothetical protein